MKLYKTFTLQQQELSSFYNEQRQSYLFPVILQKNNSIRLD